MILLCDEDIGAGVPTALHLVGYETVSMVNAGWLSRPDVEWLAEAGRRGWLVLSCNKKMLQVPFERETIIREKVGIVFLTTGQERSATVLWLLLGNWDKLAQIDADTARPFARFLSPRGRGRITDSYRGLRL